MLKTVKDLESVEETLFNLIQLKSIKDQLIQFPNHTNKENLTKQATELIIKLRQSFSVVKYSCKEKELKKIADTYTELLVFFKNMTNLNKKVTSAPNSQTELISTKSSTINCREKRRKLSSTQFQDLAKSPESEVDTISQISNDDDPNYFISQPSNRSRSCSSKINRPISAKKRQTSTCKKSLPNRFNKEPVVLVTSSRSFLFSQKNPQQQRLPNPNPDYDFLDYIYDEAKEMEEFSVRKKMPSIATAKDSLIQQQQQHVNNMSSTTLNLLKLTFNYPKENEFIPLSSLEPNYWENLSNGKINIQKEFENDF